MNEAGLDPPRLLEETDRRVSDKPTNSKRDVWAAIQHKIAHQHRPDRSYTRDECRIGIKYGKDLYQKHKDDMTREQRTANYEAFLVEKGLNPDTCMKHKSIEEDERKEIPDWVWDESLDSGFRFKGLEYKASDDICDTMFDVIDSIGPNPTRVQVENALLAQYQLRMDFARFVFDIPHDMQHGGGPEPVHERVPESLVLQQRGRQATAHQYDITQPGRQLQRTGPTFNTNEFLAALASAYPNQAPTINFTAGNSYAGDHNEGLDGTKLTQLLTQLRGLLTQQQQQQANNAGTEGLDQQTKEQLHQFLAQQQTNGPNNNDNAGVTSEIMDMLNQIQTQQQVQHEEVLGGQQRVGDRLSTQIAKSVHKDPPRSATQAQSYSPSAQARASQDPVDLFGKEVMSPSRESTEGPTTTSSSPSPSGANPFCNSNSVTNEGIDSPDSVETVHDDFASQGNDGHRPPVQPAVTEIETALHKEIDDYNHSIDMHQRMLVLIHQQMADVGELVVFQEREKKLELVRLDLVSCLTKTVSERSKQVQTLTVQEQAGLVLLTEQLQLQKEKIQQRDRVSDLLYFIDRESDFIDSLLSGHGQQLTTFDALNTLPWDSLYRRLVLANNRGMSILFLQDFDSTVVVYPSYEIDGEVEGFLLATGGFLHSNIIERIEQEEEENSTITVAWKDGAVEAAARTIVSILFKATTDAGNRVVQINSAVSGEEKGPLLVTSKQLVDLQFQGEIQFLNACINKEQQEGIVSAAETVVLNDCVLPGGGLILARAMCDMTRVEKVALTANCPLGNEALEHLFDNLNDAMNRTDIHFGQGAVGHFIHERKAAAKHFQDLVVTQIEERHQSNLLCFVFNMRDCSKVEKNAFKAYIGDAFLRKSSSFRNLHGFESFKSLILDWLKSPYLPFSLEGRAHVLYKYLKALVGAFEFKPTQDTQREESPGSTDTAGPTAGGAITSTGFRFGAASSFGGGSSSQAATSEPESSQMHNGASMEDPLRLAEEEVGLAPDEESLVIEGAPAPADNRPMDEDAAAVDNQIAPNWTGTSLSPSQRDPDEWKCDKCSTINDDTVDNGQGEIIPLTFCAACNTPRPGYEAHNAQVQEAFAGNEMGSTQQAEQLQDVQAIDVGGGLPEDTKEPSLVHLEGQAPPPAIVPNNLAALVPNMEGIETEVGNGSAAVGNDEQEHEAEVEEDGNPEPAIVQPPEQPAAIAVQGNNGGRRTRSSRRNQMVAQQAVRRSHRKLGDDPEYLGL